MADPDGNGHASTLHRIHEGLAFFMRFARDPRRVGVPVPSSSRVASRVCRELQAYGASRVVELGAGTGSITRGVLAALPPGERPLCIEREPSFCRVLRDRYSDRAEILEGDAVDLPAMIAGSRWENPDAIVCSVPLVGEQAMEVCRTICQVLPADSLYLQLTNFAGPVKTFFDVQKTWLFLAHIPPEHLHRAFHKNHRPRPRRDVRK
jgi:phosphatidylethanolamine/phosphatidyl-N-methylethanolamine N-methyltransferase